MRKDSYQPVHLPQHNPLGNYKQAQPVYVDNRPKGASRINGTSQMTIFKHADLPMTPKEKMPRTPNVNSAARKPVEQLDVIARKTGPINGKTGIEVHLRQTSPSQLRTDIVHLQKRWDEEEAKSEVSKIETVSKLELGKSRIGKDISIPKKQPENYSPKQNLERIKSAKDFGKIEKAGVGFKDMRLQPKIDVDMNQKSHKRFSTYEQQLKAEKIPSLALIPENRQLKQLDRRKLQDHTNTLEQQLKFKVHTLSAELQENQRKIEYMRNDLQLKAIIIHRLEEQKEKLGQENKRIRMEALKAEDHLVKRLQDMKDKLNQEVAKYADANLRLSELLQAVNDANEKLASSVKQVADLKSKLEAAETKTRLMLQKNKPAFLPDQNSGRDSPTKAEATSRESQKKIKTVQQQNVDLKKRVQSYKKSLQQMNNSNNSTREKQMILKEENKILQEQLRNKENFIATLYNDIKMLDGEIREQAMLKTALIASQRSVEELTQVIVLDNIGRLNAKYAKRNY